MGKDSGNNLRSLNTNSSGSLLVNGSITEQISKSIVLY